MAWQQQMARIANRRRLALTASGLGRAKAERQPGHELGSVVDGCGKMRRQVMARLGKLPRTMAMLRERKEVTAGPGRAEAATLRERGRAGHGNTALVGEQWFMGRLLLAVEGESWKVDDCSLLIHEWSHSGRFAAS